MWFRTRNTQHQIDAAKERLKAAEKDDKKVDEIANWTERMLGEPELSAVIKTFSRRLT